MNKLEKSYLLKDADIIEARKSASENNHEEACIHLYTFIRKQKDEELSSWFYRLVGKNVVPVLMDDKRTAELESRAWHIVYDLFTENYF